MKFIEISQGQTGYAEVIRHVLSQGSFRSPRGERTLDLGPTTVQMWSTANALPTGTGRGLNRKIAAAEAVQLIGGFSDPKLITWAAPVFNNYAEDDGNFHGAYGLRIGLQTKYVVDKLKQDPETRQAVITLWDPDLDNIPGKRDYPCTVALNFQLTEGGHSLDMNVLMRSNDAWLGFPYDIFQFTQLQTSIARALDVFPGRYTHTAWSFHIYEKNIPAAEELVAPSAEGPIRVWTPDGIGRLNDSIATIQSRAKLIAYQDLPDMTQSEMWYRQQFHGFAG